MLKYYKQWSVVDYNGVSLVVLPQAGNKPSCLGCYFSNHVQKTINKHEFNCVSHGMACTAHLRKDKHNVIFRNLE